MDYSKMFAAAYQYGMPVIYSLVLLGIIYKFAAKVLDSYERRETVFSTMLNKGLADLVIAIKDLTSASQMNNSNEVLVHERMSKDMKDGFENIREIAKYQRDDLATIHNRQLKDGERAEAAREKILSAIADEGCRVKSS